LFAPERITQPVEVVFVKSRSAPQCLQIPWLVGPPGRGRTQWCAQAVVAECFEAIGEILSNRSSPGAGRVAE
jgi:hypothetical protein